MIKWARTVAQATAISAFTLVPAFADDMDGQLVLRAESVGDSVKGHFSVPQQRVTLRIKPVMASNARISINEKVVFEGSIDTAGDPQLILTDESAVHKGRNTLGLTLLKGSLTVSVDYPTLQPASQATSLSAQQKRLLRHALQPYIGTDPNNSLFPGAAVLVAQKGEILFAEGQGMKQFRTVNPKGIQEGATLGKTDANTVFDLASVTKVVSTTAAIMHLVSDGKLSLQSTLGELIPGMADTDKVDITVQQLLTHRAGLWQWQPTWLHKKHSRASVFAYLAALPRRYDIGEKRAYSDIGFMLLGRVVESLTGTTQNNYVEQEIFAPLGMNDTMYKPPVSWQQRIAATSHGNPYEQTMVASGEPYPILSEPAMTDTFAGYRDYTLVGEANDGNAWYGLDGVAGHAGLFSTVYDLAIYCQTLLNGGGYGNYQLASPETVADFLDTPYDTNQALGFWRYEEGDGRVAYGHPGFTGTQIWFRPDDELIVIMLTNRQHNGLTASGTYPSVKPAWNALLHTIEQHIIGHHEADNP
ncbi:serine hydrolase domain-containing protein [Alteromonas sp. 14N.309.X.WAT.G.H12]|uniref:serine hydrolase domain-containing protein n=1 Tax=Alteromonas sp. 14N.309.X.WAT.G.H12 TaxID=3120824 RepID=UPI002FD1BAAC